MLALHRAFNLLLEILHGRFVSDEFVCHTNASRRCTFGRRPSRYQG